MKLKIFFISLYLLSIFIISGCSQREAKAETQIEEDAEFDRVEIDNVINDFTKKYNAVDFALTDDLFTVDIIDTHKGKNLFTEIYCIDDVIYIEDEMYMCAGEMFSENQFLLKITTEQYTKIKTFETDDYEGYLCAVFSLDNIEMEFSALDAYFNFNIDIEANSTIDDYGLHDSYTTRIVKGTLIDIIEIKN